MDNTIFELYQKMAGDVALRKELGRYAREGSEEKVNAFVKKLGYDITMADVRKYTENTDKRELSGMELDMVAGGKSPYEDLPIIESVLTLGIACAIISLGGLIDDANPSCEDYFG